jgi:hypothetical protein
MYAFTLWLLKGAKLKVLEFLDSVLGTIVPEQKSRIGGKSDAE